MFDSSVCLPLIVVEDLKRPLDPGSIDMHPTSIDLLIHSPNRELGGRERGEGFTDRGFGLDVLETILVEFDKIFFVRKVPGLIVFAGLAWFAQLEHDPLALKIFLLREPEGLGSTVEGSRQCMDRSNTGRATPAVQGYRGPAPSLNAYVLPNALFEKGIVRLE
jgi:hypothetical protein